MSRLVAKSRLKADVPMSSPKLRPNSWLASKSKVAEAGAATGMAGAAGAAGCWVGPGCGGLALALGGCALGALPFCCLLNESG